MGSGHHTASGGARHHKGDHMGSGHHTASGGAGLEQKGSSAGSSVRMPLNRVRVRVRIRKL